eukprot:TRINITY_DN13181_c0_g1_i1.p1 TRINITY_DN13181_c0_g1~~TRINITY_DN13181_c0_g1_i1.p1  ORF type:complete len:180 (-),score=30.61 TRINITY_DN13181_c0_g1_i1:44-583(-)
MDQFSPISREDIEKTPFSMVRFLTVDDDIDQFIALVNEAYLAEANWKLTDRTHPKEVHDILLNDHARIIIATLTDHIESLVATIKISKTNEGIEFGMFAISPSHQGKGYGKHLLSLVETLAKQEGITRLYCQVAEQNKERLLPFYQKMGFRETEEWADVYIDIEDKYISMNVLEKQLME